MIIKQRKLLIHLFASTKWQYDETMSNSNRGKMLVLEEQSLVTKVDLGIHALQTLKCIHWVDICTSIRVFKSQRREANDPRLRRRWRKKLNKFRRSLTTASRSSVNAWSARLWMERVAYYHLCMLESWLPEGEVTSSNNHRAASKVRELERVHVMKPADQLTQGFKTTVRCQLRLSKGVLSARLYEHWHRGRHGSNFNREGEP